MLAYNLQDRQKSLHLRCTGRRLTQNRSLLSTCTALHSIAQHCASRSQDSMSSLSRGACGSHSALFPVVLCGARRIILSKALGHVGMDPASGAVLLRGSCVSSLSFVSNVSYFCQQRIHRCSAVDGAASKGLPDQTARSKQTSVPLVDAVRAAGDVDTVYSFHIPGHKVGSHANLSTTRSAYCSKTWNFQFKAPYRGVLELLMLSKISLGQKLSSMT